MSIYDEDSIALGEIASSDLHGEEANATLIAILTALKLRNVVIVRQRQSTPDEGDEPELGITFWAVQDG